MRGREVSPLQVRRLKSEDTLYRLLITTVGETFDIRFKNVSIEPGKADKKSHQRIC